MFKKLKVGYQILEQVFIFFNKGLTSKLPKEYLKAFAQAAKTGITHFILTLQLKSRHTSIHDEKIVKLQRISKGLFSLLPKDKTFSYTVLLVVEDPHEGHLKDALESLKNQSTSLEILVGIKGHLDKKIEACLSSFSCKIWNFEKEKPLIEILNFLADQATNPYLFIMNQKDWIRPDLFFRYEQTLRILPNPQNSILYCNQNAISEKNYFIPGTENFNSEKIHFPYFFEEINEKGMLFPLHLWKQLGGLRIDYLGAEYEDFILRLNHHHGEFHHIPIFLYAIRHTSDKTTAIKNPTVFKNALKDYCEKERLDWHVTDGLDSHQMRAIPENKTPHSVQIIIPFKDQKKLTLKCMKSICNQTNVSFKITAVDNRSQDASIAKEIEAMGGEVIKIDEPFNFSRLNNLAVKLTKTATSCDLLLFLNNDVELESGALEEMVRWIDQPKIGMVGCRLHYPDGTLQHAGVRLHKLSREEIPEMRWEHIDYKRNFHNVKQARKISITDAVTAACALVRKEDFLNVGGFDEIWYPIGFSDTNLAVKFKNKGLLSLYTPYSVGTHYESVSRKESIEDYEVSYWLNNLLHKYQYKVNKYN